MVRITGSSSGALRVDTSDGPVDLEALQQEIKTLETEQVELAQEIERLMQRRADLKDREAALRDAIKCRQRYGPGGEA